MGINVFNDKEFPMPIQNLTEQDKSSSQKLKIILALAIPAIIENLLQTLVGFVDTLFVTKLGINEVAAVGVVNAILAVYIAIFMALGIGTSSLIARNIGAGDIWRLFIGIFEICMNDKKASEATSVYRVFFSLKAEDNY
ncbi:hypothetical protein YDYSG_04260 [Paenibacillus tyrfis]|uniref:MATE family efflux transporter n=1 Tax=Paenibacillus tyrfis TaxID=1501230 RepID=UPI00284FA7E9|nr:MATE family efflux transporter [Paenibacillus tyrfis]GLI04396.1 hypothetical protein YDYSG_04260 [Paenibacillus tyrfis]